MMKADILSKLGTVQEVHNLIILNDYPARMKGPSQNWYNCKLGLFFNLKFAS